MFSMGLDTTAAINLGRAVRLTLGTHSHVGNNVESRVQIEAGVTSGTVFEQSMFNIATPWLGAGLANVTYYHTQAGGTTYGSTGSATGPLFATDPITVYFPFAFPVPPTVNFQPLRGV
jgi:hypothetical protein